MGSGADREVSLLFEKAARIDKGRSDKIKAIQLGQEATLKCFYDGHPPPKVIWTKGKKKLGDKCAFCVQKVENSPRLSTLRVTPFRDSDFGEYRCKARNKLGFQQIKIKLREDKSKNITQCQRDRLLAGDPRLRLEFLPKCNDDGSYHMIQCSVHLKKCWCVDQSGHKIADAFNNHDGKHCKEPKDKLVLSVIILSIAIAMFLLIADVICLVTKNKGVLKKCIRFRNKHKKYGKLKLKEETKPAEIQESAEEDP